MSLVGAELGASGAMRRVRTAIMPGQVDTIANAVRHWRNIQLAHFVFYPPSVCITLWLGDLDLSCHHFSCIGLLFFDPISIILRLEAAQIDLHILLGHAKAGMSKKLFYR